MAEAITMSQLLISEFTRNYMEKLFYFCLKKTGNANEAEDLAQDIALNILSSLNKGTVPEGFSAWVWKIARNRYSKWADRKRKNTDAIACEDISEYQLEDIEGNVLDTIIENEQMALLRRELAFIKNDYRDIIIAFYIKDISIRNIAKTLSISEDAVKHRLMRARKTLKEGMNMAREFGKRSYNPENISFAASGSQPSGLPWGAVRRKIPKNILLQANNNPSTIEELSIELGIAMPYMEEEVEILKNATLLEQIDNKYVTNFFILDKECQLAIYSVLRNNSKERSRLIKEYIEDSLPCIRALGIAGEHITDNEICWWLIPHIIDECILNCNGNDTSIYQPPVRSNGETWGFVGYETIIKPENVGMGHNGNGNNNAMFWSYKYDGNLGMWDQCGEMPYNCVPFFAECLTSNRNISSFNTVEKDLWQNIDGKYAHSDNDGNIVPDILIIKKDALKDIHNNLKAHKNYNPLIENFRKTYNKIEEIFKEYSHKILQDSMGYNIIMEMYSMRMMAIHDLIDNGFLQLPKDKTNSTYGMILFYEA